MTKLQNSSIESGAVSRWWRDGRERLADQMRGQLTWRGMGDAALYLAGRLVYGLRLTLAMVLLWLRGFVMLVAHGVAGLSLAAFVVMLIVRGVGAGTFDGVLGQFWPLLVVSFALFALGFLYDMLVLAISPTELMLFQ